MSGSLVGYTNPDIINRRHKDKKTKIIKLVILFHGFKVWKSLEKRRNIWRISKSTEYNNYAR